MSASTLPQRWSKTEAAPALVVACSVTWLDDNPVLGLALAAVIGTAWLIPGRIGAARVVEWILVAAAAGGGIVLALATTDAGAALGLPWTGIASASVTAAACRLLLRNPWGGPLVTVATALVGLTACGGSTRTVGYAVAVLAFVLASLRARAATDPVSAPPTTTAFHLARGLGVALAAVLALGSSAVMSWLNERIVESLGTVPSRRIAFSSRFVLGSMGKVLLSDDKVLRVHGDPGDHLRGEVYSHYGAGQWSPRPSTSVPAVPGPAGEIETPVRIEPLDRTASHYFLPLDTSCLASTEAVVVLDEMGVATPGRGAALGAITLGRGQRGLRGPRPPDGLDLEVPEQVHQALAPIAAEWTLHATTVSGKLSALEHRLSNGYGYSLEFTPNPGIDPVVDFVLRGEPAHCEYFASALALLARTHGIHARVVGGYLASERNPLGGYTIVRSRHAHAWVEAWLPGDGWKTFDPTPAGGVGPRTDRTTPLPAALADLVGLALARTWGWITARAWWELGAGIAVGVAALLGLRWWRRTRRPPAVQAFVYERPAHPQLAGLLALLESTGVVRAHGEPLERLADRACREHADNDLARSAAELLQRYSALRYGGIGDVADLANAVNELASRARSRTSPTHG